MRTRIVTLLLLLACLTLPVAALGQSDSATRIVILPFNVAEGSEAYVFGLATALQRSLNTVDGWYVPPIGDAALVSNRVQQAGLDVTAILIELFDADVIVSGLARGGTDQAATLFFVGPGSRAPQADVTAGEGPAALVAASANAILEALGRTLSASEQQELERMSAQTPSLPSLGVVGLASTGLPGARSDDLAIASNLDPSSSWVRAEYARALLRENRIPEAVFAAKQATELLQGDPEAWAVYGVALLSDNRNEEAVAAFDRALQLNPSHALARAGRGNVTGDRTDLEGALAAYPRLLDAYLSLAAAETELPRSLQILRRGARYLPESVALHRAAVARVVAAGDAAGASAYLRSALATPLGASPSLYQLATELPPGQAAAADALLAEGLERFPSDPGLVRAVARSEIARGDLEAARVRLELLSAGAPNDADTANLLALVLTRLGAIEEATSVLSAVSSNSRAAELNLAVLLLEAGRSREALAILEPAAAATPNDARIQTYYGIALARTGRQDAATDVLTAVLEANPGFALASSALSTVLQQATLTGEGSVAFEGGAAEAFDRGLFALENNDYPTAAAAFADARGFDDHPLLAFYQGYALQLSSRHREAIAPYERAIEGFPDSDTAHNNYGYAFLQTGRLDRALSELRTAIELNDQNARAHLNLGLTMFQLQRYSEALASWDRAVAIDPRLENEIAGLRQRALERVQP